MTDDDPLIQGLEAGRPAPRAGFRADLRRRLLAFGPPPSRPRRLWLLVAAHGLGGALLLGVGAAGAAGVGPLAG